MKIDRHIFLKALAENDSCSSLSHQLPAEIGLSIDSRTIEQGQIFFAHKGPWADGHDHIPQAIIKGARLIVAERSYRDRISSSCSVPVLLVDSTLDLFSSMAHHHLRSIAPTVVAITGSSGKTTTKEMLRAILLKLLGSDRVFASTGTNNNHIGVPKAALQVFKSHDIAIFEIGMNHRGELSSLCDLIEPDIGAITNIGLAHEGNFARGIDDIAMAKGELFESLAKRNKLAVINLDDQHILSQASRFDLLPGISFAAERMADIMLVGIKPYSLEQGYQEISLALGHDRWNANLPLVGVHHAKNALCALAVVHALGLSAREASSGLMDMQTNRGRMSICRLKNGAILINDGYNANPNSMAAGITASLDIPAKRRIAVIGTMGELGKKSEEHHYHLGSILAEQFDRLFLCGEYARVITEAAIERGFSGHNITIESTSKDLIKPVRRFLQRDDLVFIKGSLSSDMQIVAHALGED